MSSVMLSPAIGRSQPGIRFETVSPVKPEAMPRMDIAAFVGFAERGPLHYPVVIEDMAKFAEVFGATPQLGWNAKGERVLGNLAESVSSYFIQGGQRCWVVRVAGSSASSNQFILPGLFTVTKSSGTYTVLPALAQARCEGSWSDPLRVSSRLQSRPVVIESLRATAAGNAWELRTRSETVRTGDLVRIIRDAGKQQSFFPIAKTERDNTTGELVLYAQAAIAFVKHNPAIPNPPIPHRTWDRGELGTLANWLDGQASLLGIDLRVRDDKFSEWRMENLGLTPLHSRYCGALPTDMDTYRGDASRSGVVQQKPSWFPLAVITNDIEPAGTTFMLPLDMDGNFSAENTVFTNSIPQLERDGLTSFETSMFLDPALRSTSLAELIATADAIRYSSPKSRPLNGIHAVLGWFNTTIQDEISLIAVPDAVHLPWQSKRTALSYTLAYTEIPKKIKSDKPASFSCCDTLVTPTNLSASATTPSGNVLHLSWMKPEGMNIAGIEYQIQESVSENFLLVDSTWKTKEASVETAITAPGRRLFRVRAVSATHTSSWSVAIAVNITETESDDVQVGAGDEITREIQQALIRLCAAQGELFTVLSLPKKISEQDAGKHVQSLSETQLSGSTASNVNLDTEGRVGSYAAVYHPWIETRSTTGLVRPIPPDGAILGMIAARTRERGAWIAPANSVLRSVVALHTELPASRQTLLLDAGINLILHRPEGYTLLSEDTLSGIPDLQPIHVRRLLILLRRIVLRLGEEFTFETNGLALRALIRQRCYNMLNGLYRAGAFDGRSASEAFQVSIDDTDNTQASLDAGRLIIRIRVRPAQALRFITLRFALGGGTSGVSEENAT